MIVVYISTLTATLIFLNRIKTTLDLYSPLQYLHKSGKRSEHILLSLVRKWFRLIRGFPIVEDPKLALRSLNKYMYANRAERYKVVRALFGLEESRTEILVQKCAKPTS
jgi:hypothetical protein